MNSSNKFSKTDKLISLRKKKVLAILIPMIVAKTAQSDLSFETVSLGISFNEVYG